MMVLSEVLQEHWDGWRETGGIKWKLVKQNHNWQIQVICPRCGRIGNLVRANSKNRVGYRVLRGGGTGCHFGWTQEEFDTLDAIYRRARGRRF